MPGMAMASTEVQEVRTSYMLVAGSWMVGVVPFRAFADCGLEEGEDADVDVAAVREDCGSVGGEEELGAEVGPRAAGREEEEEDRMDDFAGDVELSVAVFVALESTHEHCGIQSVLLPRSR